MLIPCSAARDSREGESPGTAIQWAGPPPSAGGITAGRNGRWVHAGGNARIPRGRRKLRRGNPKSAAGVKKNRQGCEGSKPSRG
jgi:hypothetical protein